MSAEIQQVVVPIRSLNSIVEYLADRPYREVANLIGSLQTLETLETVLDRQPKPARRKTAE